MVSQGRFAPRQVAQGSQGLGGGAVLEGWYRKFAALTAMGRKVRKEGVAALFIASLLYGILPAPCTSVQTLRGPPCERRRIWQFLTEAHSGATLWARRFTELLCHKSNTSIIVNPSLPPPCLLRENSPCPSV